MNHQEKIAQARYWIGWNQVILGAGMYGLLSTTLNGRWIWAIVMAIVCAYHHTYRQRWKTHLKNLEGNQ